LESLYERVILHELSNADRILFSENIARQKQLIRSVPHISHWDAHKALRWTINDRPNKAL